MTRLALLLALPLAACGDDTIATSTDTSTSSAPSTGEPSTGTSTTSELPTTSSAASSSSGSASASDGSSSTTADTTQGIDASSSSTTADPGTSSTTTGEPGSSTTADSSSSTDDASSSSSSSSSTGDESTGEVDDLPLPAGLCAQGDLTSFVEPIAQPEELHIVAVYQATGNALTVTINRTDVPITLVLNSYEPVAYTLVLAPGVLLERVILDGYNHHTVQGQGAAMVTDSSGNFMYLAACGYYWPENDGGCDTPGLVTGAETLTGLELAAFVGCYEGSSFTID